MLVGHQALIEETYIPFSFLLDYTGKRNITRRPTRGLSLKPKISGEPSQGRGDAGEEDVACVDGPHRRHGPPRFTETTRQATSRT